jgi:hypothetical protein
MIFGSSNCEFYVGTLQCTDMKTWTYLQGLSAKHFTASCDTCWALVSTKQIIITVVIIIGDYQPSTNPMHSVLKT